MTTSFLLLLHLFLPLFSFLPLASANTTYGLTTTYNASNFFTAFDFFTDPDPTHGLVIYQSQTNATALGLAAIVNNGTQVYLSVDNSTATTTPRANASMPAVRLQSKATYDKMLLVADVAHMPFACGAWPALWTWAEPWPQRGEIDIIEGVNSQVTNHMTLHTNHTCTISAGTNSSSKFVTGSSGDCSAPGGTGLSGCSQEQTVDDEQSYGAGFNANGGGVYAMEWTAEVISVWFFARGAAVPAALVSTTSAADQTGPLVLDVEALGTPVAQFVSGDGCDYDERFGEQRVTIDTTFCGDWAGLQGVWEADTTCSAKAASCEVWMAAADPNEFDEAYWLLNWVSVYKAD